MLETVLGQSLKWNYPTKTDNKTFRNLIDEYVYPLPWSDLGIDLALGSVIDREATEAEKSIFTRLPRSCLWKCNYHRRWP